MSLWIGRNLFLRRQPSFFFPNHQFSRFNSTIKYTTNPKLRNVAIIAHVDHGKTTLVDCLLKQAGAIEHNHSETRVMDSNKLEQERGITILSKVTSLKWGDVHVNIVDTPGHGDFGGEVERVLSMVDGVVLLVDATEGPMTQTKYVLSKALQTKLRPLVVINKMDRPSSRPQEVETEVFDLFSSLEANDEQLNYPTIYASAKAGWAKTSYEDESLDMSALLQTIVRHVPPPTVVDTDVFKLLVTSIETEPFTGRILTGRVASGYARAGVKVYAFDQSGQVIEEGVITKVFSKVGVTRTVLEEGMPGDLLSIAGLSKATVNMTICSSPTEKPIPAPSIDPPVLSVSITVNDSPLAGKEGTNLNPAAITERLFKEATHNVSLTVQRSEIDKALEVSGRGELHLGILIENLRREGFEINISQPRIIFKEENGRKLEPQEELLIDVEEQFSGLIMERMVARKAEMIDVRPYGGKIRIRYLCVSRALLGLKPILDNETRGSTQLHHTFHSYVPHKGPLSATGKGSIISMATGKTTPYALDSVQERGILYVGPNTPVYEGMIIGENAKPGDLDVNPCKEKQLSNVRAAGKDDTIKLAIPKVITLEEAICRIQDDELIEVTPKSIRLRKKILSQRVRQTTSKKNK